jgi:transcriptional regulator with XRE-family HTH domain
MLEAAQIRAARALLDWRQEDLAKASGVGTATIRRMEKSRHAITGYALTLVRIQQALEEAGILFIDEDEGGGYGLRLAKNKSTAR